MVQGNLLDLEMLDVAKKDSTAPSVPTEWALSSEPQEEDPIDLPALTNCPLQSPRRLLTEKNWPLCREGDHQHPQGLPFQGWMSLTCPPRGCSLTSQYTHGDPVGLHSLETLQLIVSHNAMMGEVQYQYQLMVASMMSLQLDLPKSSDHPNSPP